MSTRNRYRNRLSISLLSAILFIVGSLAVGGIGIVVGKNRVRAIGEEQRKVEAEASLLQTEIHALHSKIETLLTRDRVQPRLSGGGTLLRPISKERLLFLKALPTPATAVQAVPTPSLAQTSSQHP